MKKISSTSELINQLSFNWLEQLIELDRNLLPGQNWSVSQWHGLFQLENQLIIDFIYHSVEGREQVVGFSLWSYSELESLAHLLKIAVDHDYRMMGVGTNLLEPDWLRARSIEKIFLEVAVINNNAINLYQSQGFEILHLVRKFYSNGDDAYKMIKKYRI